MLFTMIEKEPVGTCRPAPTGESRNPRRPGVALRSLALAMFLASPAALASDPPDAMESPPDILVFDGSMLPLTNEQASKLDVDRLALPDVIGTVDRRRKVPEFGTAVHADLSTMQQAITPGGRQCMKQLVLAQYWQDIVEQFNAAAHFDNCSFDESLELMGASLRAAENFDRVAEQVQSPEMRRKAVLRSVFHIGQALHAVQDFFSHTNFVEQASRTLPYNEARLVPPFSDPAAARQWLASVRQELGSRNTPLVSGTVWWNSPKDCADGALSHAELNKDARKGHGTDLVGEWDLVNGPAPTGKWPIKTAYDHAVLLAQVATERVLRDEAKRLKAVADYCGEVLIIPKATELRGGIQ